METAQGDRFGPNSERRRFAITCRISADFVAEVAEEESGPWRRATSLACHSPVRAVAGDYSNDCQRAFGVTLRSRHACGREWRRPCHELSQPPEVLSDRCQRELELSPARPAQSQAAEPQDTLEMCKQHLNALSVMARSLECFSLGERASNVTGLLVDAALDSAHRQLWTALRLEDAAAAIACLSSVV